MAEGQVKLAANGTGQYTRPGWQPPQAKATHLYLFSLLSFCTKILLHNLP